MVLEKQDLDGMVTPVRTKGTAEVRQRYGTCVVQVHKHLNSFSVRPVQKVRMNAIFSFFPNQNLIESEVSYFTVCYVPVRTYSISQHTGTLLTAVRTYSFSTDGNILYVFMTF